MNHSRFIRLLLVCSTIAMPLNAMVLDDFENGATINNLGGTLAAYTDISDSGNSQILNGTPTPGVVNVFTVLPVAGQGCPQGTPGYGLVLQYASGTIRPHKSGMPSFGFYLGLQMGLSNGSTGGRDLTGATAVTFWAKTSNRLLCRFMVATSDIKDYGFHRKLIIIDTVWKKYTVNLDSLNQPTWARLFPYIRANTLHFNWEISGDDNFLQPAKAGLWIDDVNILDYNPNSVEIISDVATTSSRTPKFKWHAAPEAKNYTIQIASNNSFSTASTIVQLSTTDTTFVPTANLPIGMLYWRVKADNSYWSVMGSLTILDATIPSPIPVQSPTYNRKPVLKWYTVPLTGPTYTIQISQSAVFSTTLISFPTKDTFFTPTVDLPLGQIFWRLKADSSGWSGTSDFAIDDDRVPVLVPCENPTSNRKPTLRWFKPPRPITSYTIQLSTSSNFSTVLTQLAVTDTFFTPTVDLPIGSIYWHVKSDDSKFSGVLSFLIRDARIPAIIPYEPDLTLERTPTFRWYKVSGAETYTIEVANAAAFSSPIVALPITDTLFKVQVALPIGPIYWRVKSNLVDTYSDIDFFAIMPDSIPLLIRFNGRVVQSHKPQFAWYSVKNAASYKIMLANNAGFTNALTIPQADTFFAPSVDLESGKWYWKVSCSRDLNLYSPVDSLVIGSSVIINNDITIRIGNVHSIQKKSAISIAFRQAPRSGRLAVQDVKGRMIVSRNIGYGTKEVSWDYNDKSGNRIPSGVYIVRISGDNMAFSSAIIVQR